MAGSSHSPYYCGPPPVIAHASHTGDQEQTLYDLDTELTYRCEHGYVRDHNKVVSASWAQIYSEGVHRKMFFHQYKSPIIGKVYSFLTFSSLLKFEQQIFVLSSFMFSSHLQAQYGNFDRFNSWPVVSGWTDQYQGFDNAKCFFINGTAVWFGPDLNCKPIDCGPAHNILHGIQVCISLRHVYDTRVNFRTEVAPTSGVR